MSKKKKSALESYVELINDFTKELMALLKNSWKYKPDNLAKSFEEIYKKHQEKEDPLVKKGNLPFIMRDLVVIHFFTTLKKERPEIFNNNDIGKSNLFWRGGIKLVKNKNDKE